MCISDWLAVEKSGKKEKIAVLFIYMAYIISVDIKFGYTKLLIILIKYFIVILDILIIIALIIVFKKTKKKLNK